MTEKRSHFGMAGHYAAMAEFLLRGYNVAIPSVDIGDDVFVVDDRFGTLWRVQVKTADGQETRRADGQLSSKKVQYTLSRRQLRETKASELFFMLTVRWEDRWRFLLVPRPALVELRDNFVAADRGKKPGRKPRADQDAKSDDVTLVITWTERDAKGWSTSFRSYMNAWPEAFPQLRDGPGSRTPDPLP